MKKRISSLLVLLIVSLFLIAGCEKGESEIILQPADSTAVFNLAADSNCSVTHITGKFLEGKTLTGDQQIQVEVTISKAGKWSFSTDTLNGFSFSGNGIFADTGKRLLTLNALGIPDTTGNFYFSLTKGSVKRLFSISVLRSDMAIETVPLKSYFQGTIGGVKYYVEARTVGPDDITYASGGRDTGSFGSFVAPGIYPNPPGTGTLSLQKGFLFNYSTSTEADFKNFFKPGAYPFSANDCNKLPFSGMILFWHDSDNQIWGTLKKFADQSGSSFSIVGVEDGHDKKGIYFVKVKSRFNCKLYNLRTGEMKVLTDGELVSFF